MQEYQFLKQNEGAPLKFNELSAIGKLDGAELEHIDPRDKAPICFAPAHLDKAKSVARLVAALRGQMSDRLKASHGDTVESFQNQLNNMVRSGISTSKIGPEVGFEASGARNKLRLFGPSLGR